MARPEPVVSTTYPYLSIRVSLRGKTHDALALLDTGFSGHLAVPESAVADDLKLPDASTTWELADGSIVDAPLYLGSV